ncbi:MAG: UPF0758 domain-containing protein [archaeon]
MKIKEMPKQNRPRERFLKYGPEVLSDAELFFYLFEDRDYWGECYGDVE